MGLKVYVNGEFVEKEDAKISVFDHGLLYGDGVFEGIRVYHGKAFKLDEHVGRLYEGASYIDLEIPMSRDEMKDAINRTVGTNGIEDGYIRAIVTRGIGTLGLDADKCSGSCVIIIVDHIALYPEELYEKGMEIVTAATRRNISEALNVRVKSLNYLNNILAKIEGTNAGCAEALMLNQEGFVAECTGDNIFIVRDGVLKTPPESAGILKGITRQVVMDLAKGEGILVEEPNMTRYDVMTADECFLTGSAAEIIGVVKLDGRTIGDGKPGEITRQLRKLFKGMI